MSLKIVRNDITKMNTEAIVNTANDHVSVGPGCDSAVYNAAGFDKLLSYRQEKIGFVPECEAFITPGFNLSAKYIIHAVSPLYMGGKEGEEGRLRSCYRKSLGIAKEKNIKSISFPLISTGGFGYPKEEGIRIAVDEINAFLLDNEMDVYLVVFDEKANSLGKKIYLDLEEYIDQNYVDVKGYEEYNKGYAGGLEETEEGSFMLLTNEQMIERRRHNLKEDSPYSMMDRLCGAAPAPSDAHGSSAFGSIFREKTSRSKEVNSENTSLDEEDDIRTAQNFQDVHENRLEERMQHISDTFSQYLLYLIQNKNLENAEVYKRAVVDKKIFSKIKNNIDYHPQKMTALCLCVGAMLNLDETKDLLARAGYALSPCDKTDIIFSYFIENEIYDMIELDIQLEEHGLPCIIS